MNTTEKTETRRTLSKLEDRLKVLRAGKATADTLTQIECIEYDVGVLRDELAEVDVCPAAEPQPKYSEPQVDFDWDGLFEALGETEVRLPVQRDRTDMVKAMGALLNWFLSVDLSRDDAPCAIGRKVIALAWNISPSRTGGTSLRKLAKRLGITAAQISKDTADAARRIRVTNEFKSHDWRAS